MEDTHHLGAISTRGMIATMAIEQAIAELLPLVTAEDAKDWFRLPFNALQ